MSRAVMQQALEALEALKWRGLPSFVESAITTLRKALAEPEQEPVSLNNGRLTQYPDGRIGFGTLESVGAIGHPPTPRKPQTTHWEGCEAVHPECRKQEPVAWMHPDGRVWTFGRGLDKSTFTIPLYTAPTPPKPLPDEDIDELSRTMVKGDRSVNWLCRAIERAHGITGEQT